jgi:hypothetical protein
LNASRSARFELVGSPLFALSIIALHAAAGVCAFIVVPGSAGIALAIALLLLGIAAARSRAWLAAARSIRAIEVQDATAAIVELANGERWPAKIAERRYVGRFMVNIPVLSPVRRTFLVCHGMLGEESFRRLRIWALWGKLPGVAGKQLPA